MVQGASRPPILCIGCGKIHFMSPSAMAAAIVAFMAGDMHTMRGGEIWPRCLLEALVMPEHTEPYAGRKIDYETVEVPEDANWTEHTGV